MKCKFCDNPSGYYPLCKSCYERSQNGEIGKCLTCDEWFEKRNFDHEYCYECYTKKQKEVIEENLKTVKKIIKEKQYAKQVIIGKEKENTDNTDPRKKWEACHQCDDGHYVRSYSEVLIDNWLYHNGHVHAYEKSVFMPNNPDENMLSDFYLPKGNVYIEFWGLNNNDRYAERKEYKIELYKNNNLNLINLEEEDIKRLNDKMPRLIHEFTKN
jgi:hypothetical protein